MLVPLKFALSGINAWLVGLKTSPKVVLPRERIDTRCPPSPSLNVRVALENPAGEPTRIKAVNLVGVEQIFVRRLPIQGN
jgi:hypothetical protein